MGGGGEGQIKYRQFYLELSPKRQLKSCIGFVIFLWINFIADISWWLYPLDGWPIAANFPEKKRKTMLPLYINYMSYMNIREGDDNDNQLILQVLLYPKVYKKEWIGGKSIFHLLFHPLFPENLKKLSNIH